jgi:hypothetical protein
MQAHLSSVAESIADADAGDNLETVAEVALGLIGGSVFDCGSDREPDLRQETLSQSKTDHPRRLATIRSSSSSNFGFSPAIASTR